MGKVEEEGKVWKSGECKESRASLKECFSNRSIRISKFSGVNENFVPSFALYTFPKSTSSWFSNIEYKVDGKREIISIFWVHKKNLRLWQEIPRLRHPNHILSRLVGLDHPVLEIKWEKRALEGERQSWGSSRSRGTLTREKAGQPSSPLLALENIKYIQKR